MSDDVQVALIGLIVPVCSLLVIGIVLVVFRKQIAGLTSRTTRIKVAGFELELATQALIEAKPNQKVSAGIARGIEERAARLAPRLMGVQVLWVDDQPHGNKVERRFLRVAGLTVVNARTSKRAFQLLDEDDFGVVITDIERAESPTAGIDLARDVAEQYGIPVIGYIGSVDLARPVPAGLLALTDRPDVLISRILDAVEASEW
ncbi:hypothetical protein HP550_14560 [Cellulomonas humilata]|uniref:Response regulatory domain-containing protein n=1 Tax=Cellulomonas humilata TaxID=144055 RepID=A0A7Y6A2C7_9CELL|nr:hypothetical protein [Cellulomonas humilata]NUU18476.1 hypothetical protein [Cellulomonas humilata]